MTITPRDWWTCSICGQSTNEPHTDIATDEDVCPDCCEYCNSGQAAADLEQFVKENRTRLNPGDATVGHGIPTHSQSASWWGDSDTAGGVR